MGFVSIRRKRLVTLLVPQPHGFLPKSAWHDQKLLYHQVLPNHRLVLVQYEHHSFFHLGNSVHQSNYVLFLQKDPVRLQYDVLNHQVSSLNEIVLGMIISFKSYTLVNYYTANLYILLVKAKLFGENLVIKMYV